MIDVKDESKYLASLSVFRELYDSQKDIYGVICALLNEVITTYGKHKFSRTEITNILNSNFDFSLPEAVVGTSLNRLDYLEKSHGKYNVINMPATETSLRDLRDETLSNNEYIFQNLIAFIEKEKNVDLTKNEKKQIVQTFCAFLLDESVREGYSEFISGFIIKYKDDEQFKNRLNKIREGIILYSGIKYSSNLGALGSWRSDLTIYLDTEILFHLAGFNGSLYKSLFYDFFDLIKEINQKAKKKLVRLKYFKEVKKEIDGFFAKAENIVAGNEVLDPSVTAMDSIIDGCKYPSDVVDKKSDFYLSLKKLGIYESEGIDFSQEKNYEYNLSGEDFINKISADFNFEISAHLKYLNYVSIKREDNNIKTDFNNIGYILLTGKKKTISLAWHNDILPSSKIPLATTLTWITNRFWFQLNKGFGSNNLPNNFDVIIKAQLALSTIIDRSVSEKYDELISQFKQGKITEEQAKARIIHLRSQARKPEDIKKDEISSIIETLSKDNLEEFVQEQEKLKTLASRHAEENVELKDELEDINKTKEKHISEKKEMIDFLENNKKKYRALAIKDFNKFKVLIGICILAWWLIIIGLTIYLDWTAIEPWMTFLTMIIPLLISPIYLLATGKSLNPVQLMEKKKEKLIEKKFSEFNFDEKLLDRLKNDIRNLEKDNGI